MQDRNADSVATTDAPAPVPAPEKPKADETNEGSIKETIESILIAFILAFIFRGFVVEAFVIPTGSMATTLLGAPYAVHLCRLRFSVRHQFHRAIVQAER